MTARRDDGAVCASDSAALLALGGWTKAQQTHFADGGVFDKIYEPGS